MEPEQRPLHWDAIYTGKSEPRLSWFEPASDVSLSLIEAAGISAQAAVIDIGGGASRLVDGLLARGYADLTVLDLSRQALEVAGRRLGSAAARVSWLVDDVTGWQPERTYRLWHDRAAFHFLTDPADQRAYVQVMSAALEPGGIALIGTFAPDGPDRCSGLPVARQDGDSLARILGPGFERFDTRRHDHVTPSGAVQRFQFSSFRRL